MSFVYVASFQPTCSLWWKMEFFCKQSGHFYMFLCDVCGDLMDTMLALCTDVAGSPPHRRLWKHAQGHEDSIQGKINTIYYIIGIGSSILSHPCPENIFRTTGLYATKLGLMVHHHDPECHAKSLGFYLQGQVTVWAQILKITVSSIFPEFWTFCNQTWYSGPSSWARVLCDNFGLLSSRPVSV